MQLYKRAPAIVIAKQFQVDKEPWPPGVQEIQSNWAGKQGESERRFHLMSTVVYPILSGDWVVFDSNNKGYVVKESDFPLTYKKYTAEKNRR